MPWGVRIPFIDAALDNDGAITGLVQSIPETFNNLGDATINGAKALGNLATLDTDAAWQRSLDATINASDAFLKPAPHVRDLTGGLVGNLIPGYNIAAGPELTRQPGRWVQSEISQLLGVEDKSGIRPLPETLRMTVNEGMPGMLFQIGTGHRATDIAGSTTIDVKELLQAQATQLRISGGKITVDQYNQALEKTVQQFKEKHGENVAFSYTADETWRYGIYGSDERSKQSTPITNVFFGLLLEQQIQDPMKNNNVVDNFKIEKTITLKELDDWRKANASELPCHHTEVFSRYLRSAKSFNIGLVDENGHVVITPGMMLVKQPLFDHVPLPRTADDHSAPRRIAPPPTTGNATPDSGATNTSDSANKNTGSSGQPKNAFWDFISGNKLMIGGLGIAATVAGFAMPMLIPLSIGGIAAIAAAWGPDIATRLKTKPTESRSDQMNETPPAPEPASHMQPVLGFIPSPTPQSRLTLEIDKGLTYA